MDLRGNTSPEALIDSLIDKRLFRMYKNAPAIVTAVNTQNQTLSAKVAYKLRTNINGEISSIDIPELKNIPYFSFQGGDFIITIPPKAGDICILHFSDRDCDDFIKTGNISEPSTIGSKMHAIDNAFAIVGYNALSSPIQNFDNSSLMIRNKEGTTFIKLANNSISLKHNNNEAVINEHGLTLNSNETININGKNVNVNATNTLTLAGQTIKLNSSSDIEINAQTNIKGNLNVTGAVKVTGDLDAALIKGPIAKLTNFIKDNRPLTLEGELAATSGYLVTGELPTLSNFLSYMGNKDIVFNLSVSGSNLTITIDNEIFTLAQSFEDIATYIEALSTGLFSASYSAEDNHIKFITTATGSTLGVISFLEDIFVIEPATKGRLLTSTIGDFTTFINGLNSKGLSFKINCGGKFYDFTAPYSEITSLDDLISYLAPQNASKIIVTKGLDNDSILFTTAQEGAVNGFISYLQNNPAFDTPATLTSSELDPNFNNLKTTVGALNLAFKVPANGIDFTFYVSNSELNALNSYDEFATLLNRQNILNVIYSNNKLIFRTYLTGNTATIDFAQTLTEIEATKGYLITGALPSFSTLKTMFDQATPPYDTKFFINVNGTNQNFSVSLSNWDSATSYHDIATTLQAQTSVLDITYNETTNRFLFITKNAGQSLGQISYMQYTTPADQTIETNGAKLFMGTQTLATTLHQGTDSIDSTNLFDQSAESLKLTSLTNATKLNGVTSVYNPNSADILKGTLSMGATLHQGTNQQHIIINNSATLLRGTENTGAFIVEGLDEGEDPTFGDQFDGTFTLEGNLKVTGNIISEQKIEFLEAEGEKLKLKNKGDDTIQKTNLEVEGETLLTAKRSPITVQGSLDTELLFINGETITKEITALEKSNLNGQTKINNGCDVIGNINISNGKIQGSGTTIKLASDAVHINTDLKAKDVYVNS